MGETENGRNGEENLQFPHSPIPPLSDSLLLLPCESSAEVVQQLGPKR
jgi:hypothetical protein